MQIKQIILYHEDGTIRTLDFNLGEVNIITGESKTGKTAIIDIVNYCMGSSECNIASGYIKDHVTYFATIFSFSTMEVFVARINPDKINQDSTSEIFYFTEEKVLEIPEIDQIVSNSNIDVLSTLFENKLGINDYTNKPDFATRDDLSVSFKHAKFYSFQPQDLIAQRSSIFFKQNSEKGSFIKQAIIDTLPYFLGAVNEEAIEVEKQIASLKKQYRRVKREIEIAEKIVEKGRSDLFNYVEESKEVGLINPYVEIGDEKEALEILYSLSEWNDSSGDIGGYNERINLLIEEKKKTKQKIDQLNIEIHSVRSFAEDASGYSAEVKEQHQRLLSIDLYKVPKDGVKWNSLIGEESSYIPPTIENINASLASLDSSLSTTVGDKPKISSYLNRIQSEIDEANKYIQQVNNDLKLIYAEEDESRKLKDDNIRRGKVIGKVGLFLDSIKLETSNSNQRVELNNLQERIDELELKISRDSKQDKLDAIMNKINLQMSNWAKYLDLEYENAAIRFNPSKLMLYADTNDKSIPLTKMGSGANWVSYHLLIHFGLHKHFIQKNRPVPRFLILDQPSQVYYPPEKDLETQGELKSSDEIAVDKMFSFMFRVVDETKNQLQVIVTDHAMLKSDEFKTGVREIWRKGKKLVPITWKEKTDNIEC
jgi:hypothetical protein